MKKKQNQERDASTLCMFPTYNPPLCALCITMNVGREHINRVLASHSSFCYFLVIPIYIIFFKMFLFTYYTRSNSGTGLPFSTLRVLGQCEVGT